MPTLNLASIRENSREEPAARSGQVATTDAIRPARLGLSQEAVAAKRGESLKADSAGTHTIAGRGAPPLITPRTGYSAVRRVWVGCEARGCKGDYSLQVP